MSKFFIDSTVDSPERFDPARLMDYVNGDSHDPLTSVFLERLGRVKVQTEYFVLANQERPDLISKDVYGDSQYWWIVLLYNGFYLSSELIEGITIQIPSLDQVEDLLFNLKSESNV